MSKETYKQMVETLATIKGISTREAAQIIIQAVASFENAKQRRVN